MSKENEKEEYVNSNYELSVKKEEGQEHCQIRIMGEDINLLVGLGALINVLVKEIKIDKEHIMEAVNVALNKEEKKKIEVRAIQIDGEQAEELEKLLKKITNDGGNK